jgi:hypothetical protein
VYVSLSASVTGLMNAAVVSNSTVISKPEHGFVIAKRQDGSE